MQVNNTNFYSIKAQKQNFKGDSQQRDAFTMLPQYQTVPLNAAKAYAGPQISQGYKEIETFDVPYVGKGKLYELSNGHKVILIPKLGPTVINTYVGCGSNNEPQEQDDTCHLLEHLLANAVIKPQKQEIKDILSKSGASYNATTSSMFTNYYLQAPITKENELEDLIKLQSEVLKHNNFTQDEIEKEKEIIKQETVYRGDEPLLDTLLLKNLSKKNLFNLKNDVEINSVPKIDNIKNITKDGLNNFYNTFYQPQNMVTAIVGNFDDKSIKTFAKYFGEKNQRALKNLSNSNNFEYKPIQKTIRKDYENSDSKTKVDLVDLSFVGPQNDNYKDFIIMLGIKEIIAQKINNNNRNNEKQISIEPFYSLTSLDKNAPKTFNLSGTSHKEDTEETLKTLYSIIYDLAQNPISGEELKKIKNKLKSSESTECEKSIYLSDSYAQSVMISQNVKDDTEYFKVINAMTTRDVINFAKKYLDLNKASIVIIHPQKPIHDENIERAKKVSFSGTKEILETKDVQEYELPNNLRVVIDSRPGISKSTINFDLHTSKDIKSMPKAQSILTEFFLVPPSMQKKLSNEGISINNGGNNKELYIRLSGEPENTINMLHYATNALISPAFSEEEFKNFRKLYSFDSDKPQKEDSIQEFKDELYPYNDDRGSLKYLQAQDAKFLHKQILDSAQGVITITVPKETLQPIQNDIFKDLNKLPQLQKFNYSTTFNSSKAQPIEKTKILLVPYEDKQIEIEKYFKVIESGNINDIAGLSVLNKLLGGSQNSKLFNHLRNEDKIAYAPSSTYDRTTYDEKFSKITLSTSIAANDEDFKKVIEEYNRAEKELINKPATQEELENAKAKVKNDILCQVETSKGRNQFLSKNYNSFYGISYQKELFDAIDKITPEQIRKLATHYLTQPYLMKISGNEEIIKENKAYLSKLGELC